MNKKCKEIKQKEGKPCVQIHDWLFVREFNDYMGAKLYSFYCKRCLVSKAVGV